MVTLVALYLKNVALLFALKRHFHQAHLFGYFNVLLHITFSNSEARSSQMGASFVQCPHHGA
jgi:hypothetical protein